MKKFILTITTILFMFAGIAIAADGDPVLEGKEATGNITTTGNVAGATYGSDSSISDADLLSIGDGATTTIAVGGGVGSPIAWTTATGSGAPVRATSPTLVTPNIGVATGTSFQGLVGNLTPTTGNFTDIYSSAIVVEKAIDLSLGINLIETSASDYIDVVLTGNGPFAIYIWLDCWGASTGRSTLYGAAVGYLNGNALHGDNAVGTISYIGTADISLVAITAKGSDNTIRLEIANADGSNTWNIAGRLMGIGGNGATCIIVSASWTD